MAITIITASYNTLADMIAAMNAQLAPLTSRTIVGAGFLGMDQVRVPGVEMSTYVVVDSGGAPTTTPYQVMLFSGSTLESAAAQVNAFMLANSSYFFSPVIFAKLMTVRNTLRDVALLFYCTNYSDGVLNWVPLGGSGLGGGGSVTSIGLSAPAIFGLAGSPVTTNGTIVITLANQSANTLFAGPASGAPAAPDFRVMVAADVPPAVDGLLFPVGLANRVIVAGHFGAYIPALGRIYMSQNQNNGKLQYIDPDTDSPVDVATFTGKTPAQFVYAASAGRFVFSNGISLFTTDANGVISAPILAANMASGMCINTQTGRVWGVATGSGATAIYEVEASTNTVMASYFVAGYGIEGPYGVAYCPTNNSVYNLQQFGMVLRWDISGSAGVYIPTFVGGGSTRAALWYDDVDDHVYVVHQANGQFLKKISTTTDTVVGSFAFPPGVPASTQGGTSIFGMGDYLYVGTEQGSTAPVGLMLVFHKPSQTWVTALSSNIAPLVGRPCVGIPSEGVLYVGGGNTFQTTQLIPFRSAGNA